MLNIYPLKPVISNNPHLPQLYNRHPSSIGMTSACVTPEELASLIDRGASFDSVVFVNTCDQSLVNRLRPADDHDHAFYPAVEMVSMDKIDDKSVSRIHDAFSEQRSRIFFASGG